MKPPNLVSQLLIKQFQQKWNKFLVFHWKPKQNKRTKIKNHSKHPKLVSESLFKQLQQKESICFVFHWKSSLSVLCWVDVNTDLRSNNNISKTVRVKISLTNTFQRVFGKLSYDIKANRLCTCRALVVDV